MAKPIPAAAAAGPSPRLRAAVWMRGGIELTALATILGAPWAFGAVEPFDFFVYVAVAVMLGLWAARVLLEWRFEWKRCPIALGLAALFLLGAWQATPLPPALAARLSPAGAKLTQALLPRTRETLPAGVEAPPPPSTGAMLSLYPTGTRALLVELLAAFLFYVAVRANAAAPGALRRLCLVAAVNGAALGFVGLLQFATSDLHKLYWHIRSPHLGVVFGPFLCRNHFPFYVNLCIGLTLGLIFGLRAQPGTYGLPARPGRRLAGGPGPAAAPAPPLLLVWKWSAILHDSRVLWLSFALVLMIGSVVCSLSRGGLLALIGGGIVGLALGLPRARLAGTRRWSGALLMVFIVGGVALLLSWFGFDLLESRHASIVQGDMFGDRLRLWRALWPLAAQFPLTGTGYGTVELVEPLHRQAGGDDYLLHSNAHNEYLEALIEGGWPRLAVTLVLIGLVYWLGVRALGRWAGEPAGGWVTGALIGLTAVFLQSFVDFGIHIPAVALLTAAAAAQVSAAALDPRAPGPRRDAAAGSEDDAGAFALRLFGLAPLLAFGLAAVLAALLVGQAWRKDLLYRHRAAASQATRRVNQQLGRLEISPIVLTTSEVEARLRELRGAALVAPDSAIAHLQLADALLLRIRSIEQDAQRRALLGELAQTLLAGAASAGLPLVGAEVVDPHLLAGPASAAPRLQALAAEVAVAATPYVHERLRSLVLARDLCPILPQPHLRIAEAIGGFAATEPRAVYLARAKRLRPSDPNLWFDCGTQEYFDGQFDEAARSWRRCLELKDPDDPDAQAFFTAILVQAQRKPPTASSGGAAASSSLAEEPLFSTEEILARIVPTRPKLIVAAVQQLMGRPEDAARRRPYLEKAASLLGAPRTADDYHTRAVIDLSLERLDLAEKGLGRALQLAPQRSDWRLELAKLYFDLGRYADSVEQFEIVRKERPQDVELGKMLEAARALKNHPPVQR